MRAALDGLYRAAAGLAAACLVSIALLVVAQVGCRLIDGARGLIGLDPLGLLVPSLAEIAGFLLVGASFLALASTLRHAAHIRVSILLQHVPRSVGRMLEVWVLAAASALICYFAWHAAWLSYDSYFYNEVSFGIVPVPLFIPQTVMTLGIIVFAVSLIDDLVVALSGREPSYVLAEADRSIEGTE
ncbi:TRAP transporter small permease [Breoghania sp. L-A4]|uniref:TRAP transporter small permease n=1 Tax=Breoghania sp. L-A4 TaxID=2304600 RepID=UPI000E3593CB|nr:TRAP transporter small permease [Breoghania sp. L-A4]AXS41344.1 TRAP transporter small permease [Breoghania sp. L-A4]